MDLPESVTSVLDASLEFIYSFQPLVEPTVVLVPDALKQPVSSLAESIGMDIETVTFVLALYMCYLLGFIMKQIPYEYQSLRHFFSFILGAFLIQFTVGVQWIHQVISSMIAYVMILVLPRKYLKVALPVFAMVYMTLGHLHRNYTNYLGWDLDFTGGQMVLTMKLYMIAYNLYDGEQLAKGTADRASKKCAPYALEKPPSLLEFLGYTFCFSNVLVGPATEYSVYLRSIDGSVLNGPDGKRLPPPSNVWPTLRPLLISFLNLAVFLVIAGNFPLLDPDDPQKSTPVVITPEFIAKPWLYRIMYCWLGLVGFRQKYYFGWKCAEGTQNIWYAGFDGYDKDSKPIGWEAGVNMNILGFELAGDLQTLSKEWNKKTSFWLTRYIYIRTGGSLIAVYSMSAFWHGFYPGYYMFFLTVPLLTFCDRLAKKKLSPYFPKSKWTPYGILGMILTSLGANYAVQGFALLSGSWTYELYKSHYFAGHIFPIIFFGVLSALPKPPKKDEEAKKKV